MSGELLYFLLLQMSVFAVGAGLAASAVLLRHRPRRWWAYVGVKVALSGIIAVLMTVVWNNGEVEPRPASYTYVALVALGALSMALVAGDLAKRGGAASGVQAVQEIAEDTRGERVTQLEDRVTAEEARNTGIEDFAAESRSRSDAAEARADAHGESRDEEHDKPEA